LGEQVIVGKKILNWILKKWGTALLTKYWGDQKKKNEMGGARSTYEGFGGAT
jgi:hypothetical protein